MNKFKYSAATDKLLLDILEPTVDTATMTDREFYEKVKAYNSRLSYFLSPELKAMLTDGQVLNENEFSLGYFCFNCNQEGGCGSTHCELQIIAIPLPEAKPITFIKDNWGPEDKPERFTLEEMIECSRHFLNFANVEGMKEKAFIHPLNEMQRYFKETFGIDIKNNEPCG